MGSIVPAEKVKHDPQTLLYYFPSMNPVRYTQLSNDFNFWRQVQTAETAARICGRLLVPASCLHWQRKQHFADRQIRIKKHSYYILTADEMTKTEQMKYKEIGGGSS